MIPLSLQQIATVTGGQVHPADAGALRVESGVVTDSREAGPGSLYVARVGEHADGHDYVAAAARTGAVAALTSRVVPDLPCVVVADTERAFALIGREIVERCQAAGGLQIVGITGSSGKTSTKDMLAQVIASLGETIAPVASYNSEIGVPLTVARLQESTAYLVAEMGASGVGHIAYLTEIAPPRIGVVLNVGSAHLGEFGSREAIARTKGELVAALPPGQDPDERDHHGHSRGGVAVLNADDPVVTAMNARTSARVVLVGRSEHADIRATDVGLDGRGRAHFRLHVPGQESQQVHLAVHGPHHVGNALAVVAVALELGMPLPQVVAALGDAGAVSRWRMEVHELAEGRVLVNDAYNANPDSMAAALRSLAAMRGNGRTIAVLGEMRELGPDSEQEHAGIGALAAQLEINVVIAVGAGAWAIAQGYASGRGAAAVVHRVEDAAQARSLIEEVWQPGDVVLLKSSRDSGLRYLGDDLLAAAQTGAGD